MASKDLGTPLLEHEGSKTTTINARRAAAWILLVLLWTIFFLWVAVFIAFPTISLFEARNSAPSKLSGLLGMNGMIFLAFGAPLVLVTLLGIFYLQVRTTYVERTRRGRPRISLWTYPLLVDGLLGVVSAAEALFILAALAYVLWAMVHYAVNDSVLIKKFMKLPFIRDSFEPWQLWTYVLGLNIGFLGLVCLSFLFIPVSRGSPLLRLIDIPFEHAAKYHVWLGHLTMSIFTIHGLCYVVVWTSQKRLIAELLEWRKVGVANLPGVISLVAGLFLWMTSFGFVRFRVFELFFYTHQLYIVFIVFMAFHIGETALCICLAGFFLYMLDRFLRFCQSRRPVQVLSWRVLPCGTIELLLPKLQSLNYNSLSFVFMNVPGISFLQWHPFSVSSSPYDAPDSMSFLVKPLGSWTEELQGLIKEESPRVKNPLCPVLGIEGPYGHESDYYLKYQALVLVAGGIGISPFIAILRDLLHRHNMNQDNIPREVEVVWAVKTTKELNLINLVRPESLCPGYASRLRIGVHAFVTRETEPDPENSAPVPVHILQSSCKAIPPGGNMSTLVGTYSNVWMGLYILVSGLGTWLVQVMMQKYVLGESEETEFGDQNWNLSWMQSWTVRAGALLLSMTIGTVVFGGLVIFCWNWVESSRKGNDSTSSYSPSPVTNDHETVLEEPDSFGADSENRLVNTSNICYGKRPDLKELFEQFSKRWKGENVGVLLCGPEGLQSSVATECRLHNTRYLKGSEAAVFHYHSVSFDL